MYSANHYLTVETLTSRTIAITLCVLGAMVLLSWHSPKMLAPVYPYATLMAYNTAIGFFACGLGLYAILTQHGLLRFFSCSILFAIGILTLLDLVAGVPLNTTNWFVMFLSDPPARSQAIPPTASLSFLISACAILVGFNQQGTKTLIACLLSIIILFLTLTAMLGQGFQMLPSFVWMGIKMAPHTALGLTLFAIGIISLRARAAIEAFNRLKIFDRLITGFVFMSLLFLGIGSIGSLQINSVASITQELYGDPIQVNNAVLRLRGNINKLNRQMKDIAVNPDLVDNINIPDEVRKAEFSVIQEIEIIRRKNNNDDVIKLQNNFNQWLQIVINNYQHLLNGDIETYRSQSLNQMQESTIALENLCEVIFQQAQQRMLELNSDVIHVRQNAANLMLVVIIGFLLVGVVVAALITRSLTLQMQCISETMQRLAQGETNINIPFLDHPHEMGIMAKTIAVFAENMEARRKNAQLLIQHQTELESSNHRLAQTNKELETFAYVASHDLKSPLRGIAQLSTWIEEDLAEKEYSEVDKHTQMLRNRIQRMEKLLDDMLIFYRAGKADGKLTQINLSHMAKELFEIQNTKAGLRLEVSENLPTFATFGTPFEQVIRNLFSNAIKHHDRDQGVIRLECIPVDDQFYEISVSDDGPGIPEKFQERVFGMFQTLKPRDELEGSGMGLALIKKLVEAYGGTIKVFSQGRGCRFTFTWPQMIKERVSYDR